MARPERIAARSATLCIAAIVIAVSACDTSGDNYRPVADASPDSGKTLLVHYGCGACHVIPGIDDAYGMVGPPLTAFGRRTYIAGELPNTTENLIAWLENPQAIEPGTAMPNLGVTAGHARNMAAYLYTLH